MNEDFPPLVFLPPQIKRRRRERIGFVKPPALTKEQRRKITVDRRVEAEAIDALIRKRTPEERRAIFFRLKHDRPLTRKDLSGTGLTFMSSPGVEESLVISKEGSLSGLSKRLKGVESEAKPSRPNGTDFAEALKKVEVADPKDRLSDEMLQKFDELTKRRHVVYEMEIASFAATGAKRRLEVEGLLQEVTTSLGHGVHGRVYEYDLAQDGARIVLGTTGDKFKEFVESTNWWRKIVFLDLRPKFETFHTVTQNFNVRDVTISPPDEDAEKVCVIDTGVAAGNPFLTPVVDREMSHSFIDGFSPLEDENGHGSGVASLVAYHTLDITRGGPNKGKAFIVSARITNDAGQLDSPQLDDQDEDRALQARLLSNILRDIVVHYAPKGLRIFVLSFQIQGHIWSKATRRLTARSSWVARRLDQLAREYNVVFVTITGNLITGDVEDLNRGQAYPRYLTQPAAKILDPGPAALALTVGSVTNAAKVIVDPHVPIALTDQPSPFTRSGPGFGDSNKPDFVERGGNLVRDRTTGSVTANAGTNVAMASGRLTPALQFSYGTSFAAPRVAHHLAILQHDLRQLGITLEAPLLRALLAASAVRPAEAELLGAENDLTVVGYGIPDGNRATDCSGSTVLLYWYGTISADSSAIFRLPVPIELKTAGRRPKRITVAIALAPPVQPWGIAEYLGAEAKFWLFRGDTDFSKVEALFQREDDEENVAAKEGVGSLSGHLGLTRRSAGALQRDVFGWSDHKDAYSASDYSIAVSLKPSSWSSGDEQIPLAVVARIEDTSGKCQVVYEKVKARVQVAARARS